MSVDVLDLVPALTPLQRLLYERPDLADLGCVGVQLHHALTEGV